MLKKNALATQMLSKEFMGLKKGDRIDTIKDYSQKFNLSVGTISKAIKEIEGENGVFLEKKGHLGTFIESQNYKKLWQLSGLKNIICVMPLPYLKRYEGLASGIKKLMKDNLYFAYMRGGDTRINFLEMDNYHCAILSKFAALEYIKDGRNIEIALELGEGTYIGEHTIVHRNVPIVRIGVDESSRDHKFLTDMNFQKNEDYEFVDTNYNEIIEQLKRGSIDGAIWNLDNLEELGVDIPHKKIKSTETAAFLTEAVIVVKKGEGWLKNYLKRSLNKKSITDHQNKVIKGMEIPSY